MRRYFKYNIDKRDDKELSSDCLARDYRIEEKFELERVEEQTRQRMCPGPRRLLTVCEEYQIVQAQEGGLTRLEGMGKEQAM